MTFTQEETKSDRKKTTTEELKSDKKHEKMSKQDFYKFWLDFVLESCLDLKQVSFNQTESS